MGAARLKPITETIPSGPAELPRGPGYLELYRSGELGRRVERLQEMLERCELCPRRCGVNRAAGQIGRCGVDGRAKVASVTLHPWEEPPISGTRGSGTVFFSGCTLSCVYCQNYPISQFGVGRYWADEQLARGMVRLQSRGAHNINLVTPSHQVAAFARALLLAVPMGLRIPVVYNTSGYERTAVLRLIEGLIDVYLPDIKYADRTAAEGLSGCHDYVEVNRRALLEMQRQVGDLHLDGQGVARRGLLIRHLVLPDNLAGTSACLDFIARRMGRHTWVSLLNQYFPAFQALHRPPLDRRTTFREYERAFSMLAELGLENGFVQSSEDSDSRG
jgi:putative pyruvate formate lyase activating enzyme